jgi:glycerophosphoryl diester phosphodiesterase
MRQQTCWAGMCLIIAIAMGAAGDEIMQVNFLGPDGALPDGWRPVQGQWQVRDGSLVGEGADAYILFGDENWQNYEVHVTATFLAVQNQSRWFSVLVRAPRDGAPPWMHVPVRFQSTLRNGTEFAVRTPEGWSVRQTAAAKADSVLGQPRRLRVVVSGSNVQGYLDDQLVIDTAYALDRDRGCVGLGLSGAKVRFQDFFIKRLPDTPSLPKADISRCEIVAHRGWSAVYPENTLLAAKMAVQAGADGTEFDVHATRDGVVVLMHDKTLDRTTDGTGEIAMKTLDELQHLDAGSWKDARFAGEPVPTLEQVLRALKDSGCQPVIEIKMDGIADKVVRTVRELDMVDQVAVIAFNGETVHEVRQLEPRIPCAWLSSAKLTGTPAERADWITEQAKQYHTDMVDLNYNMLSREIIAELKHRGLTVWCWTVNDPVVMQALMRWGVDSITTDRVDVLVDLRQKLMQQ